MGAHVVVTEVDPRKAIEAQMDGYRVMPMTDAAKIGDIFVTVTGNYHVIREEHFKLMKDGAIVCNSGHFNDELDLDGIKRLSQGHERAAQVRRAVRTPRRPQGLHSGRRAAVNLAAGEGHPAVGDGYVVCQSGDGGGLSRAELQDDWKSKCTTFRSRSTKKSRSLKLSSMGIEIDMLTPEQVKYMASWSEGT